MNIKSKKMTRWQHCMQKLIVSDVKKALVSSANLSYHGMQGNVEMGFLIESHDKAKQIEEVMKENGKDESILKIKRVGVVLGK